ncbi:transporter substrate-binding domain-containing protein [Burkholderia plantarii]|uniref:transporter substrate-binding domain-containing protein n=1 Tax=Burkholderia plantarii TaxID=41899 RepID=UPI001D04D189|nr:transporter substrate-binding domain-containing protein [Burkholderia plantarii]
MARQWPAGAGAIVPRAGVPLPRKDSDEERGAQVKAVFKAVCILLLTITVAHAQSLAGKTLRVGSDITSPPYIYFNDAKQPAGFDADLMNALAMAGGFKLQFLDTRFESLILGIEADKFDVIASSMFVNPARAKQIDFIPYATAGLGFIVPARGTFSPETATALCGKRVGIIKGAAYIDTIRKACAADGKSVDIHEFPTSAEGTQAVMSGNVDAQADDVAVLKVAVGKTGGRLKISTPEILYPVVLGLGVSKQHPGIKAALEAALAKIRANGVYDKLVRRYSMGVPTEAQYQAAIGAQ